MRPEQVRESKSFRGFDRLEQPKTEKPEAVLEGLFGLLEDYGPTWFTKEHRDRTLAALIGRDY